MDVDETLRELRELAKNSFQDDVERMGELVEALDGWITKGGYLPRRWQAEVPREAVYELLRLTLNENKQLQQQVSHLLASCTKLLEERRRANVDYAVREFHLKYGHPAPTEITVPDEDQIRFRFKIMSEKFLEMVEAAFAESVQRPWALPQIKERLAWFCETAPVNVRLSKLLREMHDLDYTVAGTRVVFGYDGLPGAAEVHRANMDKEPNGPDGKPVKPAGWRAPDIEGVLRAQGWK